MELNAHGYHLGTMVFAEANRRSFEIRGLWLQRRDLGLWPTGYELLSSRQTLAGQCFRVLFVPDLRVIRNKKPIPSTVSMCSFRGLGQGLDQTKFREDH